MEKKEKYQNQAKCKYRKTMSQKIVGHSESTQRWVDTKCPNIPKIEKKSLGKCSNQSKCNYTETTCRKNKERWVDTKCPNRWKIEEKS